MTRRPGMTMTELLVAIFVVAIGLAGVMSMVPFGAKQMSDALVADRCNTLSTTIEGTVRGYWTDKIAGVTAAGGNPTDDFWTALDNPGRTLPAPGAAEPSYPVFLDPFGVLGKSGNERDWVGFNGVTNVPRRNMNLVGNSPNLALRLWSQPDGFTWDDVDGTTPVAGATMRELRYSALAVIQRPTNSARLTATLKVVTFSNRPFQFNPPGAEVVVSNNLTFTPGLTTIQVPIAPLTAANVDLKKGNWLMDATVTTPPAGTTTVPATRHANFYRVVSATENTTGTYDVELASPIRRTDGGTAAYAGTLVFMPGVSAVYEFPALTGSTAP